MAEPSPDFTAPPRRLAAQLKIGLAIVVTIVALGSRALDAASLGHDLDPHPVSAGRPIGSAPTTGRVQSRLLMRRACRSR
jgi:hypothetical protein